jgi:hypothetical protein
MNKALLIKSVNGIFDANKVSSVTAMKTGVAVTNEAGELMYWHSESNEEKSQKLADLLSDAVMERLEGGDGVIDFSAHGLV